MPLGMISISTAGRKQEDKQGEGVTPNTNQGERGQALLTYWPLVALVICRMKLMLLFQAL